MYPPGEQEDSAGAVESLANQQQGTPSGRLCEQQAGRAHAQLACRGECMLEKFCIMLTQAISRGGPLIQR